MSDVKLVLFCRDVQKSTLFFIVCVGCLSKE